MARYAAIRTLDNSRYNEYISSLGKGTKDAIKQAKPFGSLAEETFVVLLRTADQLAWRGAEVFKQHELSPTQYNALRILRGAGAKGLACSEIGERMINRDPDITRLIDRLERRGLVARSREQKDRRVITTRITTAGLEVLKKLDRPVEEFHRQLLGPLGQRRLRSLLRLLEAARRQAE
jgi:DNA-binding MarR family transcriptional regulator